MAQSNEPLTKPITDSNDLQIWDIDDSNFESAFLDDKSKEESDPLLGQLDLNEESDSKKEDTSEDKAEINMDIDTEESSDKKEETEVEFNPESIEPSAETEEKSEEEEKEDPVGIEKEKAEESEESEENEFSVFAKLLAEKELLDLNEEEFEPTEEGLIDAFASTIESRVKEEIELFQKSLPGEGKELLNHLMRGGKVSDFTEVYSAPDMTNIEIKGDSNINNQRAVLKEFLRLRGDNQEDIEETIQDYEDLGKLERQAERAQERLASYYEHQKEQLAQRQQQENVQREQKRREVLETIESTVSSSEEIKGFPMTRKAKKDLLSYMTETSVKIDGPNGPQYVTKFQADEMEAGKDVNDFILRAYLRMTDFNLDKVKKKTTSDFSSKLKTQLQNSKSRTDTKAKFGGNKKTGAATKSDAWTL